MQGLQALIILDCELLNCCVSPTLLEASRPKISNLNLTPTQECQTNCSYAYCAHMWLWLPEHTCTHLGLGK